MNIRPAKPTDAQNITHVLADSCEVAYSEILADEHLQDRFLNFDVENLENWLERTDTDDDVIYLVAETEKTIIGFVQFVYGKQAPEDVDSDVAFLKSLYVRPDNWKEGIGEELLTEGISRVPESMDRVELAVLTQNNIGRGFYEKQGFDRVGSGNFDIRDTSYDIDVYAKNR